MSNPADYYARKDRERLAAWQALEDAKDRDAPEAEIRELQRAYERAAYVGD